MLRWLAVLVIAIPAITWAQPNKTTTAIVQPSGGDDTAAIQNACNRGAAQLVSGVYHVTSVTCRVISGLANADVFFWYQGQKPTIEMRGVAAGKRGVVTCPSPGPCTYSAFTIYPPPGTAGVVLDSVRGAELLDLNVVDDGGGDSSHCVDAGRSGIDNQNFLIRGGTYIHCGGWCFEMDVTSDSRVIGADIANCQKGLVHIGYGFGWVFSGNHIQDGYGNDGIVWECCGDGTISNNLFDHNASDMRLGANGGVYLVATGNMSCNNAAFLNFAGPVYIFAAANMSCGPTYVVSAPGARIGTVGGGLYDPAPSYLDAISQTVLAPLIH